MGMSIDEIIEELEDSKDYPANDPASDEALNNAINIMHKYQKIQEIVRWNDAPSPYYKPDGQLFREICEVLEDGNNAGNN